MPKLLSMSELARKLGDVDALAADLKSLAEEYASDEEVNSIDFRVRFFDSEWHLHTGDASYDQDHRGYSGCGSIGCSSIEGTDDYIGDNDYNAIASEAIEMAIEDMPD